MCILDDCSKCVYHVWGWVKKEGSKHACGFYQTLPIWAFQNEEKCEKVLSYEHVLEEEGREARRCQRYKEKECYKD